MKECDHLTNVYAIGNDGVFYCTICEENHNWKKGEMYTCKSYYDEQNILKDCTCGNCK